MGVRSKKMKLLVINSGSSSLKYQVFDMENEKVLAKGVVDRIGLEGASLCHSPSKGSRHIITTEIKDHEKAIQLVLDILSDKDHGIIKSLDELEAIGHRVVHGGEDFSGSVLINEEVMEALKNNIELAPLHNPPNIMGIEACKKIMPEKPQVGVFDTAFHYTMPEYAYIYGIPYEYYKKYKIRKYGFHGTSHQYVSERAAAILKTPIEELKIISCHLGNGASLAAIKGGKSIDTSMGFTPLEGLMMGTRSGDIDPAVVSFLIEKENWTKEETNEFLNKRSGALGLSGISSDFRDIQDQAGKGHVRSQLAIDRFAYVVKKYIGSYFAIMNGLDVLVFTAGLGENSSVMRAKICQDLEALGIEIDYDKNFTRAIEAEISTNTSKVKVLVIPTNEELMIARDTYKIVSKL